MLIILEVKYVSNIFLANINTIIIYKNQYVGNIISKISDSYFSKGAKMKIW